MPDWNVHAAVRLDDEEAVEADRAARERADRDADAAHLACPGACRCGAFLLVPLEQLAALVERFLDERAGRRRPACRSGSAGPNGALPAGALILRMLDLIDAELARGLREDRLDQPMPCMPPGARCERLRRRVGQHRQTAPPHRLRLIRERDVVPAERAVALRVVRTVVADRRTCRSR